jgi:hypothetical protein
MIVVSQIQKEASAAILFIIIERSWPAIIRPQNHFLPAVGKAAA